MIKKLFSKIKPHLEIVFENIFQVAQRDFEKNEERIFIRLTKYL